MQTYRFTLGSCEYFAYGETLEQAQEQVYRALAEYYPMSLAAFLHDLEGRVPTRTITDYYSMIKGRTAPHMKLWTLIPLKQVQS